MERVQVEIGTGAICHPGADLYSFTKVGGKFHKHRIMCLYVKDPVWELSRDLINLKEEIGQGAFGQVRRAEVES